MIKYILDKLTESEAARIAGCFIMVLFITIAIGMIYTIGTRPEIPVDDIDIVAKDIFVLLTSVIVPIILFTIIPIFTSSISIDNGYGDRSENHKNKKGIIGGILAYIFYMVMLMGGVGVIFGVVPLFIQALLLLLPKTAYIIVAVFISGCSVFFLSFLTPFWNKRIERKIREKLRQTADTNGLINVVGDVLFSYIDEAEMILIPEDNGSESFYIDKYEVTNAQFAKFLNETREGQERIKLEKKCLIEYKDGAYRAKPGYEKHPVIGVNINNARDYAQWAQKRLPTGEEWAKAKGSGEINLITANYNETGYRQDRELKTYLKPVGRYPPNEYGLYDMRGNVREWIYDREPTTQPRSIFLLRTKTSGVCGESWLTTKKEIYLIYTDNKNMLPLIDVGFRCVMDTTEKIEKYIQQLKEEHDSTIGNLKHRFGIISYRDWVSSHNEIIDNLRQQSAIEPLIEALNDENIYVRRQAALALGDIGNIPGIDMGVLLPLEELVLDLQKLVQENDDSPVRQRIMEALLDVKRALHQLRTGVSLWH